MVFPDFELFPQLKGNIIRHYIVTLFCTMISRRDPVLRFINIYF